MRRAIGTLAASAALHAVLPASVTLDVAPRVTRTLVPIALETVAAASQGVAASTPRPTPSVHAASQPRRSVARPRSAAERSQAEPLEAAQPVASSAPAARVPAPPAEPIAATAVPSTDTGDETAGPSVAPHAVPSHAPAAPTRGAPVTTTKGNDQHAATLQSMRTEYLDNLRKRVAAHQRYPYQARRAGIEGTVCLKLRLNAEGRLSALASTCDAPAEALLEAAFDAVRAAAPFGPLPSALGAELAAELPVVFRLEQRAGLE